jgi:hypothetical protein
MNVNLSARVLFLTETVAEEVRKYDINVARAALDTSSALVHQFWC